MDNAVEIYDRGGCGDREGGSGRSRGDSRVGERGGRKVKQHDFVSCRGHPVIIATCDPAREREATKELVNLLNQTIEEYGLLTEDNALSSAEGNSSNNPEQESISDMIQQELAQVRCQQHSGTQCIVSVKSGVKGIAIAKVMKADLSPVELVCCIFDKIKKEKLPCSRHIARLIPLQRTFYPQEEDFNSNFSALLRQEFPSSVTTTLGKRKAEATSESEGSEIAKEEVQEKAVEIELTSQEFIYSTSFKARNHNTLTKLLIQNKIRELMPSNATLNYRHGKVRLTNIF